MIEIDLQITVQVLYDFRKALNKLLALHRYDNEFQQFLCSQGYSFDDPYIMYLNLLFAILN